MSTITELAQAVERLHDCKARHVESIPVKETFRGKTVWEGVVQAFELSGHPNAQRCYAWSHLDGAKDERTRFVAVLAISPVDSAVAAVRAAIVSEAKTRKS